MNITPGKTKVVIFAGGLGSRLSEETVIKPKPMVDICGKPIIMHIMEHYMSHGYNDFVILGGYKCAYIKEYFLKYKQLNSDFTLDMRTNTTHTIKAPRCDFSVTILDTGLDTSTGTRLKQAEFLLSDAPFMLTYGDGISDIDITELVKHAKTYDKILTISIVSPKFRFGTVEVDANTSRIIDFYEKRVSQNHRINGGFMVVKPEIFEHIPDKNCMFEEEPIQSVTKAGECYAYVPPLSIAWYAIDTLKDKKDAENYLADRDRFNGLRNA